MQKIGNDDGIVYLKKGSYRVKKPILNISIIGSSKYETILYGKIID